MTIPEYPITREEMYLDAIARGGGGGGGITVTPLSVTENGTYTAPSGTAYSPVTVDVASGETVYTSSTGMLYTPKMTIVIGGDLARGRMISDTLSRYGNMPYLEELTLTGTVSHSSARTLNGNAEDLFSAEKFPALRKLRIAPDEIRTDSGAVIDPSDTYYNAILWNHYAFGGTNLAELEIGKVDGPYMYYGGYFRKDMPVPPGTAANNIGSEIGMTLIVYVSEYSATGKFTNGVLAPNTTVICKDYRTGEVLTA